MNLDKAKFNAASEAVKLVKNGMVVGLGTGSTAKIAVDLIGKKLSEKFQITGMPTSIKTKNQAERYLAFEELLHFRVLRGSLS